MVPTLHWLAAAILATSELCAKPVAGGIGEPALCRIDARQAIATPYFSIMVEPEFLVGVDREGRRLRVLSATRLGQSHLTVEVVDGSAHSQWPDCHDMAKTVEDDVTWLDCRASEAGEHRRRLGAVLKGTQVLIHYAYTALGTVTAPALERMTQSVRIQAKEPPSFVEQLIGRLAGEEKRNPPASIWRYRYRGQTVYYLPPHCCDMPSSLYDERGALICSPDGGLTGRGDGKCPDFFDARSEESLVWSDRK
jgi:hypothetical protein